MWVKMMWNPHGNNMCRGLPTSPNISQVALYIIKLDYRAYKNMMRVCIYICMAITYDMVGTNGTTMFVMLFIKLRLLYK